MMVICIILIFTLYQINRYDVRLLLGDVEIGATMNHCALKRRLEMFTRSFLISFLIIVCKINYILTRCGEVMYHSALDIKGFRGHRAELSLDIYLVASLDTCFDLKWTFSRRFKRAM